MSKEVRKKPKGRPVIQVTDDMVKQIEALAGYGLNHGQISDILGIGTDTLSKKKKADPRVFSAIQAGKAKAAGQIGKRLFDKANDGDMQAIIWYEKTRLEYREKTKVDIEQKTEHTIKMTLEQEYERAKKHFEGQKKCKSGNVIVNTLEENSSEQ